jgi:hypothetical protein
MAKQDKEFMARMQGMIYAYRIAKESGIEALEKDIRKRNITNAPFKYSSKQIDEFCKYISQNVYTNILATMCWTLNDVFGFGEKRLKVLIEDFNKKCWDFTDLDYVGKHYIRLEDVAIELNQKYHLGLDIERITACERMADENDERIRMCKIDRVLEVLKEAGYQKAAEFLESKLD